MCDWQIRKMCEQDIDEVEQIEKEIFSVPWSAKSFSDACKNENNIYLTCIIDDEVAGYCGLWTVLGEGNITNMAVSHKHRRKGIGRALMQEMEKRGREKEVSVFFLEVRESNSAARALYEGLGYEQIGVRKRFYEKPVESAVIMSKGWRT